MALTQYLGLSLLEPSQAQPDVTVNLSLTDIDMAIAGRFSKDMSGLTSYTLTGAESTNWMLNPWNAAAAFTLVVQATDKGWLVINDAAYDCTVKTASGTGVVVPAESRMLVYCDSVNVRAISAAIGTALPPVDRIAAGDLAGTTYTNAGGKTWVDYVTGDGTNPVGVTVQGTVIATVTTGSLSVLTPPGGTLAMGTNLPGTWFRSEI